MDAQSAENAGSKQASSQQAGVWPLIIVGVVGLIAGYVLARAADRYEKQAAIEINYTYAPAAQKRLVKQAQEAAAQLAPSIPTAGEKNP